MHADALITLRVVAARSEHSIIPPLFDLPVPFLGEYLFLSKEGNVLWCYEGVDILEVNWLLLFFFLERMVLLWAPGLCFNFVGGGGRIYNQLSEKAVEKRGLCLRIIFTPLSFSWDKRECGKELVSDKDDLCWCWMSAHGVHISGLWGEQDRKWGKKMKIRQKLEVRRFHGTHSRRYNWCSTMESNFWARCSLRRIQDQSF